jgi:hypothetical protein
LDVAVSESAVQIAPVRRTQRVTIAMQVVVHGGGFQETSSTVTVNAAGCLVMLKTTVAQDDPVWLINLRTREELQGKVVYLGKPEDGKIPVGVEFSEPSPLFWGICFPPEDWRTSAERKRPGSNLPQK